MLRTRPFTLRDAHVLTGWLDGPDALRLWSGNAFSWPLDPPQGHIPLRGTGGCRNMYTPPRISGKWSGDVPGMDFSTVLMDSSVLAATAGGWTPRLTDRHDAAPPAVLVAYGTA